MLARAAGMPMKILDAYLRFQEELETVNTIVGGLGRPYKRRCGIPQGDPLSMLMVALLMRAWVSKMKTMDVKPSLLVDDILVIAEGKDMALKFKKAMDATHQYLKDMGGTIAPNKSHNSASTNAMKKWLKNHVWELIGGKVEVVQHFKYLGGQVSATAKLKTEVLKKRFARATAVAYRLANLRISVEKKMEVIEAKIIPMAIYGVELANPPEESLRKLCTAILACITNRHKDRKVVHTFEHNKKEGEIWTPRVSL